MRRNLDHGLVAFTRNPRFAAETVEGFLSSRSDLRTVFAVYSGKHSAPEMVNALQAVCAGRTAHFVMFEDFGSAENTELLASIPVPELCLIAVDLCRMLSNRLDSRLDKIQVRKRAGAKICVDPVPYLARPWQVYFPYSLLNKTWLGYNHSYAIEGEWEKYKDGKRPDPCAVDLIAPQIAPATFTDSCCYFQQPEVYTEPVSEQVRREYERYKAELFKTESGIKGVLAKLHKFVQGWCPQRSIPLDLKKLYTPGFGRVVKTDLPLDTYLHGEMMEVINHTNALMRRLHNGQNDF